MKNLQEEITMLIIIDRKMPGLAKEKLAKLGRLVELETSGITYGAISGHPDIFFHKAGSGLIVAPNVPLEYIKRIEKAEVNYIPGEKPVREKYPASSAYNAVSTGNLLIHNLNITDPSILKNLADARHIHVEQGYTRCNLLALDDDHFISSDKGIERALAAIGKNCLLVDPGGIQLEGFDHGFFGGCCGIHMNIMFTLGSLTHYPEGGVVREYASLAGLTLVELFDGPMFDGGSIIFIN